MVKATPKRTAGSGADISDPERQRMAARNAKADVDDILMPIKVHNRGPEDAAAHILPQLWSRNSWVWGRAEGLCTFAHDLRFGAGRRAG